MSSDFGNSSALSFLPAIQAIEKSSREQQQDKRKKGKNGEDSENQPNFSAHLPADMIQKEEPHRESGLKEDAFQTSAGEIISTSGDEANNSNAPKRKKGQHIDITA
ncbi:MAG TPA: hypothetical protein DHU63_08550 [Candidatus Marinimicrobia bacterium]|nr:MAG: hypothetical protein AUJ47_05540 [Candidatus Marinimicrobia bacterium CG1_02_48_14]PIZ67277.1 MAG: hypothetical protein COY19_05645 [Candidatus Marinimicrobia bacterium CG_4_10_14_0_2_um_filter_48_9]PJA52165.1 MAG: hypothetical protein CO167_10025 [Candidatus Marinimicrobia bacterium CG_4_9_14_3_um_filter_48_9]HCW76574.1 hypothetical protein [Candidatus Neomarinimicrobiota bacterium]